MTAKKRTRVETTPQHCLCFARADGIDPERLAMYQRVFPPDGKVPIMQGVGELTSQVYYMVDFDRVSIDQKANLIKEMALKLHISEEDMVVEYTINEGADIVTERRMDTGAVMNVRPARDDERQLALGGEPEELFPKEE